MAWTILGWTWISKKEREVFSKPEVLFIELHERHHRRHWYRIASYRDEREATKYAFKQLMEYGFSFEQCLQMELNYRVWSKYDLTLKKFTKYLKKRGGA